MKRLDDFISDKRLLNEFNIRLYFMAAIAFFVAVFPPTSSNMDNQASILSVEETTEVFDIKEAAECAGAPQVLMATEHKEEVVETKRYLPKSLNSAPHHVKKFVGRWLPVALDMQNRYDVSIAFQIGQAAKESGWGRSTLAKEANNYFGIKCKHKTHKDHDCFYYNGAHWVKYETAWESWKHHAIFLNGPRYKKCMEKNSIAGYSLCIAEQGYCYPPDGYGEDINEIISRFDLDALQGIDESQAKKFKRQLYGH